MSSTVSYLDTTLWEFGGDFLSTDHPQWSSDQVVPTPKVLNSTVYKLQLAAVPLHLE